MPRSQLTDSELNRLFPASLASAVLADGAANTPFLRLLVSSDRNLLAQVMTERHYARGHVVVQEGSPGDAMYIIRSGRVAAFRGEIYSPVILGYRGPGEIIGEMALVEDEPRSASVIALEELRVLQITRQDFQQLINTHPDLGLGLLRNLSSRLRAADHERETIGVQVSALRTEREQLLALERLRQETTDLIVHDLRNPLGIIMGAIQMLQMVLPADILDENRELLELADVSIQRLQNLVDSMLAVARMEAGAEKLVLGPVELAPLLEEAVRRVAPLMERYNVAIGVVMNGRMPPVTADEAMLERVLANLIDNAVKYTPSGGRIAVKATADDREVTVSVTDTGPGVPPEHRERIFRRFAQVPEEGGLRRGFGLGLTFCQLVVAAHSGRIWVEPGEGGIGSRFAFTLPR